MTLKLNFINFNKNAEIELFEPLLFSTARDAAVLQNIFREGSPPFVILLFSVSEICAWSVDMNPSKNTNRLRHPCKQAAIARVLE